MKNIEEVDKSIIYVMIASKADIRELIWKWKRSRGQNINNFSNIIVAFKHSIALSISLEVR